MNHNPNELIKIKKFDQAENQFIDRVKPVAEVISTAATMEKRRKKQKMQCLEIINFE